MCARAPEDQRCGRALDRWTEQQPPQGWRVEKRKKLGRRDWVSELEYEDGTYTIDSCKQQPKLLQPFLPARWSTGENGVNLALKQSIPRTDQDLSGHSVSKS